MTDWTKQTEEMFKAWTDSQKKLMENWAETIKSMGAPQSAEVWEKTLTAWEETLVKSAKTQAEWTDKWLENLISIEGMPEAAVESTERFHQMVERWNSTQEQMWGKWFEMLRGLEPVSLTEKWREAVQNPIQSWQDGMQKVMDAQTEWLKMWTGVSGETSEKPKEK
jgi:hypothetical protein